MALVLVWGKILFNMQFGLNKISKDFKDRYILIGGPLLQPYIDNALEGKPFTDDKDEYSEWLVRSNTKNAIERTSESALKEFCDDEKDEFIKRTYVPILDTRLTINKSAFKSNKAHFKAVEDEMLKDGFSHSIMSSYVNWYPKDGYMGWHTNYPTANNKDKKWREEVRLYLIYNDTANSYMRWKNKDGEIETHYEPKGWSVNFFGLTKEPMWHCIYSNGNRFSAGFKGYE
tara:strand:- start:633 stop:1322 length:690 start_codon:yes stop_codon:yes gene_type:complete